MKTFRIFIFTSVILFFNGCEKDTNKQVTWEYKYEVTGSSGDYSVTIRNTDNNTQQWASVSNGWWYKWSQTLTVD